MTNTAAAANEIAKTLNAVEIAAIKRVFSEAKVSVRGRNTVFHALEEKGILEIRSVSPKATQFGSVRGRGVVRVDDIAEALGFEY